MKLKPFFILFLAGAIVGTFLDAFHVYIGIAYYTHPVLFQQAFWVPLIFGAATLLIGVSHFKINPMPQFHPYAFLGSFLFFVLSYLVTAWSPLTSQSNSLILFVFYIVSWGLFDRTLTSLALALLTGFIGCTVESGFGRIGQYHYTHPDFFGVPAWLFPLYLNASAAGGFLGRLLLTPKKQTLSS